MESDRDDVNGEVEKGNDEDAVKEPERESDDDFVDASWDEDVGEPLGSRLVDCCKVELPKSVEET